MPELPEVHTTTEGLKKLTKNLKIKDVWTDYFKNTKSKSLDTIKNKRFFEKFKKEIIGEKILTAERRGKNILIHLTNNKTILIHMKMTGHLLFGKYIFNQKEWTPIENNSLKDPFNKFIRFLIKFENEKSLAFSDMRKFAKVTLFETKEKNNHKDLRILGPEPFSLNWQSVKKQLLLKKEGKIKSVLMDQSIVAGIGNIYSDEILWASSIHPERKPKTLKDNDFKNIFKNMISILEKSISLGGDSMSDYRNIYGERGGFQNCHNVYRQTNKKCKKKGCDGTIKRKIIGGRSSHFCDKHQL